MTATYEFKDTEPQIEEAARVFLDYLERGYGIRGLNENFGRPIPPMDLTRVPQQKKNSAVSLMLSVYAIKTYFENVDDKKIMIDGFLNYWYRLGGSVLEELPRFENDEIDWLFYDVLVRELVIRKILYY